MSVSLSKHQLAEILAIPLETSPQYSFSGVEYDSREISGGELFICLKGEQTHGHEFLRKAYEKGASLFLVEDPAVLNDFPEPERCLVVDDSLDAFRKLAGWWRKELGIPIIAITGSVGKTTVKELTDQLLLSVQKGSFSLKSHNNHVGVPYSLCQISADAAWAVLEVGMNHPGEIEPLSSLIQPDIVMITGIAPTHLEFMKSLENIANAKAEILSGLIPNGTLIMNGDQPLLEEAVQHRGIKDTQQVLYVGSGEQSDVRVGAVKGKGVQGIQFELNIKGKKLSLETGLPGPHNAWNIAFALSAAAEICPEVLDDRVVQRCQQLRLPQMRMNVHLLEGGRALVDDAYNASPKSMQALFQVALEEKEAGRRVGFILGDMRELGDQAEELHREVARQLMEIRPEFVAVVGEFGECFREQGQQSNIPVFVSETPESAAFTALKHDFDVLFMKASRGIGLDRWFERAVKIILDRAGAISAPQ